MALTFTGPYRVECRCVGCGGQFFSETFDLRDVTRILPAICDKCTLKPATGEEIAARGPG